MSTSVTKPSPTEASRAGRPPVLLLGPDLEAVSGVSTHINTLLGSKLSDSFALIHFQVGSEGRPGGHFRQLLRLLASPASLAATIRRHRVAIVHLNTSLVPFAFWRDLAYLITAKLCGTRVVYQVHGGELPEEFLGPGRPLKALLRRVLRMPDGVVVLARCELDAYERFVPDQHIRVIPNAIDWQAFPGAEHVASNASDPLHIVYIGRLARPKGLRELLEGLARARSEGTPARLTIAGSGPEEPWLRTAADELGLTPDVCLAGPVFGAAKRRLLASADVLALPTYHVEGLPYALLEGMAAGAAVITTRVAAIPDVVTDGVHGLFVPPRDADAIASAIGKLASDRAMLARMGAAARCRVAEAYSLKRLAADFAALYSSLDAG